MESGNDGFDLCSIKEKADNNEIDYHQLVSRTIDIHLFLSLVFLSLSLAPFIRDLPLYWMWSVQ